ncbi:MAG: cobalt-precorrin-5B (C(1))-methyltransferase CbiD [Candidatus Brocadiales bacterium]
MTTQLRSGYTTGTCAAAAAKASAIGLLTGIIPDTVEIDTPIGKTLKLTIMEKSIGNGFAKCAVKKNAGDDPDVTHGCMVFARVERAECGIRIEGGNGVGTVTKPGLQIPPGEPAINPVPRRMIMKALVGTGLPGHYNAHSAGLKVTISVPNGEEIAKKTFNPRLGIIGGISIIGTTGIVKPMSEAAIKASFVLSLDVAKALGFDSVVLAPGNIGERAILQSFKLPKEQVVLMGNYVGFMLIEAAKRGFKKVVLAGHPGKLAKLIRGDFYTHSSKSKSANDLIIDILNEEACANNILKEMLDSPTVEGIIEILKKYDSLSIFNIVANKIEDAASKFVDKQLKTGAILFNMNCEQIGISKGALAWQKDLQRELQ